MRYADPVEGNFDTNGTTNTGSMISSAIALGDYPVLTMDVFLDNECLNGSTLCSFDFLKVYISTDGGSTYSPDRIANLPATNTGFINTPIDLLPFANQTVVLKITFDTGDGSANNGEGAYVDNIVVTNMLAMDTRNFPIPVSSDNDTPFIIPLHFSFNYQGADYTEVYVSPYGILSFDGEFSNSSPSMLELVTDLPKIAMFWANLSPEDSTTGSVSFVRGINFLTITFDSVSGGGSISTFSSTLQDNGNVTMEYGDLGLTAALVGISEGDDAIDPGETDISASTTHSVIGTVYEIFTVGEADAVDLSNTTHTFVP